MRKETKKYYFSVEGETEKWYLDWLQKTINAFPDSKYNVKLDAKIQKDPLARVKDTCYVPEYLPPAIGKQIKRKHTYHTGSAGA